DRAGLSTTAGFSLTVNSASSNQAPINLSLSNTSIAENLPSGTVVGTLTTTDPNPGDTFTYSLVSGTGSTDNGFFTIVDNTLRTNQAFNFEDKSSYSIRVRTDDGRGGSFERVLSIAVLDRNDAPIVATPISNRTATAGRSFRYTVPANTFFDEDVEANDDLDSLTLRATLNDGRALPNWLRFNASTGTFSGTPTSGNIGTLNIAVRAIDRAGAAASSTFTLVVR
ncbi:MAG: putative Ig domain-containing protein, partial [Leptolyngbyaceae cyanobacterium bins.349]|nr:putative Ig domain-containing protein [Leptolyngbyaceae cyanobacterium bins.349]